MSRSLVGLVLLGSLTFAAPASANEGRLWSCHGPAGQALGAQPFFHATVGDAEVGGGCALPASALTARLTGADPQGQSQASYLLPVPASVTLSAVSIDRKGGPGYFAKTPAKTLESDLPAPVDGAATFPAAGASVTVGVRCDAGLGQKCPGFGTASVDLRSVALTVKDESPPQFTASEFGNPVAGTLEVAFAATDAGLGLGSAGAAIDGTPLASARFAGCAELSPADATLDLTLGDTCATDAKLTLQLDTTKVPNGVHQLTTSVTDATGNTNLRVSTITVSNDVIAPTPTPLGQTRPAATATPTPTATPRTVDLVKLPKPLKVSRSGSITVSVLCPATSSLPCAPRLTLTASVPRKATIATGRGAARPGKRARITLRLSSAARRVVARKGSLSATLTLRGAAPTTVRLRR